MLNLVGVKLSNWFLGAISSGLIPLVRLLSLGSDVKNPFKEKNSIIYYIGLCSLRGLRSFQCPEIWLFYFLEISSYFMKKCLRPRSAISGNLKFLYLKKYPRADWAAVFSVSGNFYFLFFRSIYIFLWKNVCRLDLQTSLLPCLLVFQKH